MAKWGWLDSYEDCLQDVNRLLEVHKKTVEVSGLPEPIESKLLAALERFQADVNSLGKKGVAPQVTSEKP